MAATYSPNSPYKKTKYWDKFLDIWAPIDIPSSVTDAVYQIDNIYDLRPDLLAHDLYQDSNLWWVFAVRNPDVLTDPLWGFRTGTIIYVPTKETVRNAIGF